MKFSSVTSSPHITKPSDVSRVMQQVLLALIPGAGAMFYFFGWGVLFNLLIAVTVALTTEALVLNLRKKPVKVNLQDYSAVLTACLLALALPPLAPWWLTVIATSFAIILGKQLYGGLGFNPFNPAMVGYVVVMISFPREMTFWLSPDVLSSNLLSFSQSFNLTFFNQLPVNMSWDSITSATVLDTVKNGLSQGQTLNTIFSNADFTSLSGLLAGTGWEQINLLFLAGGIYLLRCRLIDWRIPIGMLSTLLLVSGLFYLIDNTHYLSPMTHLLSGGIMLGAFFIATDPVTASTTPRGRLIYGAGIGLLIFVIRQWGGYPDGIAFAVLLLNMAAPLIDYYSVPKAFGQH